MNDDVKTDKWSFTDPKTTVTIIYADEVDRGEKRPSCIKIDSKKTGILQLELEWNEEELGLEQERPEYQLIGLKLIHNQKTMDIKKFGHLEFDGREYGGLDFMPKKMSDTEFADAISDVLVQHGKDASVPVRNLLNSIQQAQTGEQAIKLFEQTIQHEEPDRENAMGQGV